MTTPLRESAMDYDARLITDADKHLMGQEPKCDYCDYIGEGMIHDMCMECFREHVTRTMTDSEWASLSRAERELVVDYVAGLELRGCFIEELVEVKRPLRLSKDEIEWVKQMQNQDQEQENNGNVNSRA